MNLTALLLRQYHCLETTVDDPVMCGFVAWSRGGVIDHSPGWLADPDCVRFLRAGYGYRLGNVLDLNLEATRRDSVNDEVPEHGLMLRGEMRW